ncbi:hypothetical protein ACVZD4_24885 (plasmid) [Escherichia coli]
MDKYFDRSGMAIDNAKIKCIDSVKGTGNIFTVLLAINAMDVANAITFIRAAVLPVMPLAIAWSLPVPVTP